MSGFAATPTTPDPTDNQRVKPTVMILCGGRGTRLQEHMPAVPKPLVEIGGRPILWHVIQIYLAQGFRRFLLLTGHRGEQIEAFAERERWPDGTELRCLDTGPAPPPRGRPPPAPPAVDSQPPGLA